MAMASNGDAKRRYSWWWDSHISPKNSKWLQENLTDMDTKVKQMIKLIEEDADSFARRAEMYYKKRPELMKLVEEFYRAYRALAERYDHATGVIRHAQRTMAEIYSNQGPQAFMEDFSFGSSAAEAGPHTPEMPLPGRAFVDPDGLQKDALGTFHSQGFRRNRGFTDEPISVTTSTGLKQLNDLFEVGNRRIRKGLNFNDAEYKGSIAQNDESHLKTRFNSETERVSKAEAEILALKNALKSLEAEKEANLHHYERNLERLSNLESEISRAQENSKEFNERASKAEAKAETLKEALSKLESEKEGNLLQYQQCLQKIANLENNVACIQKDRSEVHERANKAESEVQVMRQDLASVEAEKEAVFLQYKQCSEAKSTLEKKLQHAEEELAIMKERTDKAEDEIETLNQTISELTDEKEASSFRYQQCLDTIADLKLQLFRAQDEVQRLKCEIQDESAKLKVTVEKCEVLERTNETLHVEVDSLMGKLENQGEELTEKQKELGRLWASIQEERLRFLEAETAFRTLQHLHSESQEELSSLTIELRTKAQILKDVEKQNSDLQVEMEKVQNENKCMNELNLSSVQSIKSLHEEISSLKETMKKLEAEVEVREDQSNSLEQEIYCLKEEMNNITRRYQALIQQVEAVDLNADCIESSVKELQVENLNLKQASEKVNSEKQALLGKLEIMKKLLEKNTFLEISNVDLSAELEATRQKVNAIEEACRFISEEKSILLSEKDEFISRLQLISSKNDSISEENKSLENSLSDANIELEGLRKTLKGLEDGFLLLKSEKSGLITEKESLVSELGIARKDLQNLEVSHLELTKKYRDLEIQREFMLQTEEDLRILLKKKEQEYAGLVQLSENKIVDMESHVRHLENEIHCMEKEHHLEVDRSLEAQIEIFILQRTIKDIEGNALSLMFGYQDAKKRTELFEKSIAELKCENHDQHLQIKELSNRDERFRTGFHNILKKLHIDVEELGSEYEKYEDQKVWHKIFWRLDELEHLLSESQDENQQSVLENSIFHAWLRQLILEAEDVATEKSLLGRKCGFQFEQLTEMRSKFQKLMAINEELVLKVNEGEHREKVLMAERDHYSFQLSDLQRFYNNLEEDNLNVLKEKKSMLNLIVRSEEEKQKLEEELGLLIGENIARDSLTVALKGIIFDSLMEIKELTEDLTELELVRNRLEGDLSTSDDQLKHTSAENSQLRKSIAALESELHSTKSARDQLTNEVKNGKDLLCHKEKEILRLEEMLTVIQTKKEERNNMVEDLTFEHDMLKDTQAKQEKKILELEHERDDWIKEFGNVNEMNQKLAKESRKILEENEGTKQEKMTLGNELLECWKDVELWEFQATELFRDSLASAIREALLEEKIYGFLHSTERLGDRIKTNEEESGRLREEVMCLKDENNELKAQMGTYDEGIALLNGSIKTLENHISQGRFNNFSTKDDKGNTSNDEGNLQLSHDNRLFMQDMHLRVKAIKETLMEMERFSILEKAKVGFELKSESSRSRRSKHLNTSKNKDARQQKEIISRDESEITTKDIMLDEASESSSYNVSRRGTLEMDDQMLHLWENVDKSGSVDLDDDKVTKLPNPSIEDGRRTPSVESLIEKELSVDKLEISSSGQEGTKRRVLERLDSDLQKLTNLKITVEDLKCKAEIDEKCRNENRENYKTVNVQLDEVAEVIARLFDVNRRLVSKFEDGIVLMEGETSELNNTKSVRMKRIWEQARRGSEKIGRLQLELQRIQFLLLKLDSEKENRRKTKIPEKHTRILLRDYIYGGARTKQKKKKGHFCGCVEPRSPS